MALRAHLTDVEERLTQACRDRATLERTLSEVVAIRDDQAKELWDAQDRLSALLGKECRNTGSQTAANWDALTVEKNLTPLQEKLHLANADISNNKRKTVELRQELADSTARANKATSEARQSEELASARGEEITRWSEREQVRVPTSPVCVISKRMYPQERPMTGLPLS